jgi:hypothetical protein
MRKEAQLVESDSISVSVDCEKEIESILKNNEKALSESVNSSSMDFAPEKEMKEYSIDGRLVRLFIKKA